MENKSKRIEEIFKQDLSMYLTGRQRVDEQLPDAPDIEEQWAKIGESYLPDAMREFSKYPTVALGWIMFVGMAIAKYWDEDWELYGKVDNLYEYLRDRIDFDHMDDYILDQVLLLDENEHKATSTIVAECAARTYTLLIHQGYEPGTEAAFRGFIAALHQMLSEILTAELCTQANLVSLFEELVLQVDVTESIENPEPLPPIAVDEPTMSML